MGVSLCDNYDMDVYHTPDHPSLERIEGNQRAARANEYIEEMLLNEGEEMAKNKMYQIELNANENTIAKM